MWMIHITFVLYSEEKWMKPSKLDDLYNPFWLELNCTKSSITGLFVSSIVRENLVDKIR